MNGGAIIIITGKKANGDTQNSQMSVATAQSAVDWINAQNPPSGSAEASLASILQTEINFASS